MVSSEKNRQIIIDFENLERRRHSYKIRMNGFAEF